MKKWIGKLANSVLLGELPLYDSIADNSNTKVFCLDGPGGTGKTFLYKALIHFLSGKGFDVLSVAWTGIASILLPGGMTSHRAFKLPLDMTVNETCNVQSSKDKEILFKCDVIIWDEASMIPC